MNSACFPMFAHLNQFLTHNHEQSPVFPELFVVLNHPKAGFFLGLLQYKVGGLEGLIFFAPQEQNVEKHGKNTSPKGENLSHGY